MGLHLGTISDEERYNAWARIIRRIAEEHIGQAWSTYLFRLIRAVFTVNAWLDETGGFLGNWIVARYVDSTLMLLRRELDGQAGAESLRNLLNDMLEHPTAATRARFVARWPAPTRAWLADQTFTTYAGSATADHLDPDGIRADLAQLQEAEAPRVHAERTRAHRTPEQHLDRQALTFEDLHRALLTVRAVVGKYRQLLGVGTVAWWQPVPQFSTIEPFLRPWIEGLEQANEVRRLSEEDRP